MKFYIRTKDVFNKLFTKHLFMTNTCLGLVFMGAGDAIQQTLERKFYKKETYDTRRTGNMVLVGSGFGVLGHAWYKMLDTRFPGASRKTVAKKLGLEMVMGPPLIFVFFLAMGWLEKKSVQRSLQEFKQNIFIICLADWAVFAPLQAINFFFLPNKFRLLYVFPLTLVYDVFLSYVIHKEDNRRLLQKLES